MGRLDGKTFLVIGGAQGIGRGCVLAAASQGAHVVIGDLNERGAHEVADEATARARGPSGIGGDVVDRASVDAMVATALREFGRLDGLVNLAYAHDGPAPLAELSAESLHRELHVDVVGCLIAMQAVYGELRAGGGSIVNFSSERGRRGVGRAGRVRRAKAAVRLLSRTAALEWGAEAHPGQLRVPVRDVTEPHRGGARRHRRPGPPRCA